MKFFALSSYILLAIFSVANTQSNGTKTVPNGTVLPACPRGNTFYTKMPLNCAKSEYQYITQTSSYVQSGVKSFAPCISVQTFCPSSTSTKVPPSSTTTTTTKIPIPTTTTTTKIPIPTTTTTTKIPIPTTTTTTKIPIPTTTTTTKIPIPTTTTTTKIPIPTTTTTTKIPIPTILPACPRSNTFYTKMPLNCAKSEYQYVTQTSSYVQSGVKSFAPCTSVQTFCPSSTSTKVPPSSTTTTTTKIPIPTTTTTTKIPIPTTTTTTKIPIPTTTTTTKIPIPTTTTTTKIPIPTTTTTTKIPIPTITTTTKIPIPNTLPACPRSNTLYTKMPLNCAKSEYQYITQTSSYVQSGVKSFAPCTSVQTFCPSSTSTKVPPSSITTTTTKVPPSSTSTSTTKIPPSSITTSTTKVPPVSTSKCLPITVTVTEKITKKEIVTVTVTKNNGPTNNPGNSNCASKWQQCGGKNFQGPTCCQSGLQCQYISDYYSQCL